MNEESSLPQRPGVLISGHSTHYLVLSPGVFSPRAAQLDNRHVCSRSSSKKNGCVDLGHHTRGHTLNTLGTGYGTHHNRTIRDIPRHRTPRDSATSS